MIPLTFLYDEEIYWSKVSELKNPFDYIVPHPTNGVGTINHLLCRMKAIASHFCRWSYIIYSLF